MKWTHTIVRFQTVPPGSMEMARNALIRAVTMKAAGALRDCADLPRRIDQPEDVRHVAEGDDPGA